MMLGIRVSVGRQFETQDVDDVQRERSFKRTSRGSVVMRASAGPGEGEDGTKSIFLLWHLSNFIPDLVKKKNRALNINDFM